MKNRTNRTLTAVLAALMCLSPLLGSCGGKGEGSESGSPDPDDYFGAVALQCRTEAGKFDVRSWTDVCENVRGVMNDYGKGEKRFYPEKQGCRSMRFLRRKDRSAEQIRKTD